MAAPQSQTSWSKFGHVDNLLETPIENHLWVNVTPDFDQFLTKRVDFEELPFQGFLDLSETTRQMSSNHRDLLGNAILEPNS